MEFGVKNTNTTLPKAFGLQLANNALIIDVNGSVIGNVNVSANTGNVSFTLAANQTGRILNYFNITEGVGRDLSPFSTGVISNTKKRITSTLSDTVESVTVVLSTVVVPSSPFITYPNGTNEYLSYSYAGGIFTAVVQRIPSGSSTITFSNSAGDSLGCVPFSESERSLFIAGLVGALALLIFVWFSNPSMLFNLSVTVGVTFFVIVLGSVIRGMC